MVNVEVGWLIHVLGQLDGRYGELGVFLVVLLNDLLLVGRVGCLGEDTLLVQHGQDTHGLLHQFNGRFQIETEVNESPDDTFLLVLFLFENEHVVVEELLQSLVSQVDTQLLEGVELKREGA